MKLNKYWFKPKSFGYGATPITWEGWFTTLILTLIIVWRAVNITKDPQRFPLRFVIELIIIIIAFILFAQTKTKEKWKWSFKFK